VGVGLGVLAALVGIADFVVDRRLGVRQPVVPLALGGLVVLALALLNNFVHSRDAWTSVVPEGLALSAITVIAIGVTAWLGTGTVLRAEFAPRYEGVR
jgi:uncharacterized membrane protein